MIEGVNEFFRWLEKEEAYCEITYLGGCNELEIKVSILGEGDFYIKRAGNFILYLDKVKKHYDNARTVAALDRERKK